MSSWLFDVALRLCCCCFTLRVVCFGWCLGVFLLQLWLVDWLVGWSVVFLFVFVLVRLPCLLFLFLVGCVVV